MGEGSPSCPTGQLCSCIQIHKCFQLAQTPSSLEAFLSPLPCTLPFPALNSSKASWLHHYYCF